MSSIEIADLVNSRHDKVKQSIERLASDNKHRKAVIQLPPMGVVTNDAGHKVSVYQINKRDSYVIVAQLSPQFTAKLVDRWQELEEKQQAPQFNIPQTLPEALRLAADLADQLAIAAPKVAVYDLLADTRGDVNTSIVAKEIGTTANKLNKFLRDKGVKWLNADLPKVGYESWFNVVALEANGGIRHQCLVTPKGQLEIAKLWGKK